jgi:acetyl-CoA carboxylase biotin carboxylase subunit
METPDFISGNYNTHFIEKNLDFLMQEPECDGQCEDIALIAAYLDYTRKLAKVSTNGTTQKAVSRWKDVR